MKLALARITERAARPADHWAFGDVDRGAQLGHPRRVGFFDRFRAWTLEGVARPWPSAVSLFEHLRSHTDPLTGELTPAGYNLPDESPEGAHQLRWAPGALDGVMGHHAGGRPEAARVEQLRQALVSVLTTATEPSLAELYRLSTNEPVLAVIDPLLESLSGDGQVRPERVHALGLMLAREAPRREAVKLGLSLLGIVHGADDEALLLQLGAHDELSLFAAVALVNRGDSEGALFQLAKRVRGWGRIQVVERLQGTRDPAIRDWMLREGFRNSVMDEYLAFTCAMTGELHVALAAESVDRELLRGAAGILAALARGGPAPGLGEYPHAETALTAFLRHVERAERTPELSEALDALAASSALPVPLSDQVQRLRDG